MNLSPDELATVRVALEKAKRMCVEALPKFNWRASALDADALQLLNETPGTIASALCLMSPHSVISYFGLRVNIDGDEALTSFAVSRHANVIVAVAERECYLDFNLYRRVDCLGVETVNLVNCYRNGGRVHDI